MFSQTLLAAVYDLNEIFLHVDDLSLCLVLYAFGQCLHLLDFTSYLVLLLLHSALLLAVELLVAHEYFLHVLQWLHFRYFSQNCLEQTDFDT